MKYKLAIFDLDGTILDTLEDLADALNHALAESGYPVRTIDEVRRFVGNGVRKLIERAAPAGTAGEVREKIYEDFNVYYKVHCADHTRPYEGIAELVAALKDAGYQTAVVSNKVDYGVQELCRQYFPGLFDMTVGDRDGIAKKPAPDTVNIVLRGLEVAKENAVYIGDSEVDIQTAANAEMDCIAVAWGFRGEAFLREYGAAVIAGCVEELGTLLLE